MSDGRAISTCSLGPLISAEIAAADSVQGSGVIKYRGSAELSGLFTPPVGTIATFQYTQNGTLFTIPKKMRVKSSFANPLTRVTSVELGCLLDFKSDLKSPEKVDAELANRDYSQDIESTDPEGDIENGYTPVVEGPACGPAVWARNPAIEAAYPESWGAKENVSPNFWKEDYRKIGASISASWAMAYCLAKLNINATSIPLTNSFRVQEFDFSAGWVSVMSDLLWSEGYTSELDFDDNLVIIDLSQDQGTGPVITKTDLLSVGAINTGEIPAEALGVIYQTWKFKSLPSDSVEPKTLNVGTTGIPAQGDPDDNLVTSGEEGDNLDDVEEQFPTGAGNSTARGIVIRDYETPGWDYDIQEGPPSYAPVPVPANNGQAENTVVYEYLPASISKTEQTVVNNRKVPSVQYQIKRSCVAAEAPDYLGAQIAATGAGSNFPMSEQVITTNYYNEDASVRFTEIRTFESAIALAGASNISFYWPGQGSITVSNTWILSQRETQEYYYGGTSRATVTKKWIHWARTQSGQQGAAAANKNSSGLQYAKEYLGSLLNSGLAYLGASTSYSAGSGEVSPRRARFSADSGTSDTDGCISGAEDSDRPSDSGETSIYPGEVEVANRKLSSSSYSEQSSQNKQPDVDSGEKEEISEIYWVYGSGLDGRRVTVQMPYSDDDSAIISGGSASLKGSAAAAQALRFGRIYNRLTLGYRYGMELQTIARKIPPTTFAPFYLSIDGLVAQYRVNNRSWVLGKDEAVASCNAIFWGVVGEAT